MQEIEALQNAVNSVKLTGLTIHERLTDDKRKTTKKYFLNIVGYGTISPTLDYKNMNHFILGLSKGINLKQTKIQV